MALVLVTHDLGVVAGRTDDVVVMYAGQIVEQAPTATCSRRCGCPTPRRCCVRSRRSTDPATRGCTRSGRPPTSSTRRRAAGSPPRCAYVQDRCREEQPPLVDGRHPGHKYRCWFPVGTPEGTRRWPQPRRGGPPWRPRPRRPEPGGRDLMAGTAPRTCARRTRALLRADELRVEFPEHARAKVQAVSGISLDVLPGETLGPGRRVGVREVDDRSGDHPAPAAHERARSASTARSSRARGRRAAAVRPKMQMIFQDPISSLNPRRKVRDIVAEGIDIWNDRRQTARAARRAGRRGAQTVGLDPRPRARPPTPRVLRWPVPAHLDRTGA